MFWFTNNSVLLEVPGNAGNSPILFEYFIAMLIFILLPFSSVVFIVFFKVKLSLGITISGMKTKTNSVTQGHIKISVGSILYGLQC